MPKLVRKSKAKHPTSYNVHDLYDYWCTKYFSFHNEHYEPRTYKGLELQNLKQLIDVFGVYYILANISHAVRNVNCGVSWWAVDLLANPTSVIYPELYFYVDSYGTNEQKHKYDSLVAIGDVWNPSADDVVKRNRIVKELSVWAKGKSELV